MKYNDLLDKIPLLNKLAEKNRSDEITSSVLRLFREKYDPGMKKRIKLPESESIEIHSTWVSEVFTPSSIYRIKKVLENMGASELASNIEQARGVGACGSMVGEVIVVRPGVKDIFGGSKKLYLNLPSSVEYARLTIRNISISLTILTIQFIYKSSARCILDDIFSDSYKTKIFKRSKSEVRYVRPDEQIKLRIRYKFRQLHDKLYGWYKKKFSGYYCMNTDTMLPTVDFLTSDLYGYDSMKDYLKSIFDYEFESWRSEDSGNLEFFMSCYIQDYPRAFLFGNGKILKKEADSEGYGGGFEHKAHLDFEFIQLLWVVNNLLYSYQKIISVIRDKIFSLEVNEKNLNSIRSYLIGVVLDVQLIIQNLEHINNLGKHARDFVRIDERNNVSNSLVVFFIDRISIISEGMVIVVRQLEENLNVNASLMSSIVNIRWQKYAFYIGLPVIVLAFLEHIFDFIIGIRCLVDSPSCLSEVWQYLTNMLI